MELKAICDKCGETADITVPQMVGPESKQKIRSGELFMWACPRCGHRQILRYPLIYNSPSERILVCLSDQPIAIEGYDGTARRVTDAGSFIEKINIFDAGLDDVAVELLKVVIRKETCKDVDMRFLKLEGVDNELVLTYPESGQMQMTAVGFNVYEDCRGIVSRNPSMIKQSEGLSLVDRAWVEQFIR